MGHIEGIQMIKATSFSTRSRYALLIAQMTLSTEPKNPPKDKKEEDNDRQR